MPAQTEVSGAATSMHVPDTFLGLDCATKGLAWVNDHLLGWYWPAMGPQHTLYVPGPYLRPGKNNIQLLEFGGIQQHCAGEHCSLPVAVRDSL